MADPSALVHLCISGDPAAVRRAAALIRERLWVEAESPDHPNRREAGVRRYLSVRLEGEAVAYPADPLSEAIASDWLAEPPEEAER